MNARLCLELVEAVTAWRESLTPAVIVAKRKSPPAAVVSKKSVGEVGEAEGGEKVWLELHLLSGNLVKASQQICCFPRAGVLDVL